VHRRGSEQEREADGDDHQRRDLGPGPHRQGHDVGGIGDEPPDRASQGEADGQPHQPGHDRI
jgi:hypothetical protein